MKIIRQFLLFKKVVNKYNAVRRIINMNKKLGEEANLYIDNIKTNAELLVSKFPELKEVYLELLDEINA
jgi:hypothetical protein